jgi:hypothetical protein
VSGSRSAPGHNAQLARAALCVAIAVRGGAVAVVLFHTDQGDRTSGPAQGPY